MIRFLDTDVFTIQRTAISHTLIRNHFFTKGSLDDIIAVYEQEEYYGFISYDTFLNALGTNDLENYIFREKYVLHPDDDNIWQDLKEMFHCNAISTLIPIVNVHGQIMYFAYEEKPKETGDPHEQTNTTLHHLEQIESNILQEFFSEVYPQVKGVRIYNLNEWGYRFFLIMKRCGYYIETHGEKWELLYPSQTRLAVKENTLTETSFMNIYAEGYPLIYDGKFSKKATAEIIDTYWWEIVVRAITNNFYTWVTQKFFKKFRKICSVAVTIPAKHEIKPKLYGEDSCHSTVPEVLKNGDLKQLEHCRNVYGRKITLEEWDKLCASKEVSVQHIAGHKLETKHFEGRMSGKLYVIGPCIVQGYTVPEDKETFLYCLKEELKKKGVDYSITGIVVGGNTPNVYWDVFDSITIREGDIIVSIREHSGTYTYTEGNKLSLKNLFDTREEYWFYDIPIHTNYKGNQAIAKALAEYISPHITVRLQNTPPPY